MICSSKLAASQCNFGTFACLVILVVFSIEHRLQNINVDIVINQCQQ